MLHCLLGIFCLDPASILEFISALVLAVSCSWLWLLVAGFHLRDAASVPRDGRLDPLVSLSRWLALALAFM